MLKLPATLETGVFVNHDGDIAIRRLDRCKERFVWLSLEQATLVAAAIVEMVAEERAKGPGVT